MLYSTKLFYRKMSSLADAVRQVMLDRADIKHNIQGVGYSGYNRGGGLEDHSVYGNPVGGMYGRVDASNVGSGGPAKKPRARAPKKVASEMEAVAAGRKRAPKKPVAPESDSEEEEVVRIVRKKKKAVAQVPVQEMEAAGRRRKNVNKKAGGKKASEVSPWVSHCQAYAKKHGITYGQALKDAKASYKK